MSSEPPFPLLRLPSLVLSEVLKITRPNEIVALALCSRKALRIVKFCRDKSISCEIELRGLGSASLILKLNYNSFRILQISKMMKNLSNYPVTNIGGVMVPTIIEDGIFTTFFDEDNWIEGAKKVIDYVLDLFEKPIHRLFIECVDQWMIDWISKRQTESLKEGILRTLPRDFVADQEYHRIIEMLTPTSVLKLYINPTDAFRYRGRFPDVDQMIIHNGNWLTIDNLRAMNSITIYIGFSRLTSSDLNLFIKHWLRGGSPRLKFAEFSIGGIFNFHEYFEGLTDKVVEVQQDRKYTKPNGDIRTFRRGYDIRRNDGVVATIMNDGMMVWPDSDGNHN